MEETGRKQNRCSKFKYMNYVKELISKYSYYIKSEIKNLILKFYFWKIGQFLKQTSASEGIYR